MANSKRPAAAKKPEAVQSAEAPKKSYLISEQALTVLVQQIYELPMRVAEPMKNFLQENLKEVAPEQVKEPKQDAEG